MTKTLLKKLRKVYISFDTGLAGGSPIPEEYRERVRGLLTESEDVYRKPIIEDYAKHNETVRKRVEDKLKFSDVGEPIILRANEIYESVKDFKKGFKFNVANEILEYPSCVESVEQLSGVVNLKKYFKNGRILNEKFRKVLHSFSSDSPIVPFGTIGGGLVLGGIKGGPFGVIFGGLVGVGAALPIVTLANEYSFRDTESFIKEPAEKFGKDLIWLDETFGRIYRGEGE